MSALPHALQQTVRELTAGQHGLKESAGRISAHYRQLGASRGVIGASADALAYALSRMPATYAAVSAVLAELRRRAPEFVPTAVLDVGAGPGTAAWAAAETWPGLATTLLDHNREFLAVAQALAPHSSAGAVDLRAGEIGAFELAAGFGLVTCAYALTELADDALLEAASRLWRHSDGVLVLVEPGRPRDYQRLMTIRAHLVGQGAKVLAPCPHDRACPLEAPDWCHFTVRLNRSRDHMRMKGGTLGYEDEKYSYLVVARPGLGEPAAGRVLRRPEETKFSVSLRTCAPDGIEQRTVQSRDKAAFKAARKLDWGDAV
ncbi:small ribosomal subunit Rsm22 family protein [Devosia sp.]|uniref:small ribosomal subunit Rsm22 family protein n=1 Tax=Devosia sp. TaxID=1871048 RepID=UPI001ACCFBA2|nr:small ribosomal subunit Rsm22 family protein [Devosia sp.]MBN9308242.1 methyltransferase domain-containing protein [Devosia sp.]